MASAHPRPGTTSLWNRLLRRPQALLLTTFVALILAGTVALRLPASHQQEPVGLLDALFTATSAVCVTGLITVDTGTAYSRLGQIVILLLIQLGALGLMTFAALAAEVVRVRLSLSSQVAVHDAFFQRQTRISLRTAALRIVTLTFVLEGLGAVLLHSSLPTANAFEAVFLAVSAFCNAGFSLYADSLTSLRGSLPLMAAVMALVTLGGLGYPVLLELLSRGWARLRRRHTRFVRFSLHTRIVLWSSLLLTAGGALTLLPTGWTHLGNNTGERLLQGLFQSVTARTAGFHTIGIGSLPLAALLIFIPLMLVGGSPGSCAGGVKTVTATVWLSRLTARLRGRETTSILGRRLPFDLLQRASLVITLAAMWNVVGVMILALSEGATGTPLESLMFEQVSAFGTVGLSTGLTPDLSTVGKVWIILTMLVGRVGPLTMALAVVSQPRQHYEYPVERVMIG